MSRKPSAPPRAERTLLLLGGREWHPECRPADGWWLARARRPLVAVLTSAAQDIPETAVEWARAHFATLGAELVGCFIQTPAQARDPELVGQLASAPAIYLCGGDPAAAQRVLAGSPAARALRSAYRKGTPVAGSSAGAMVLAEACLAPARGFSLSPGLGLAPGVVVPHWQSASQRWREQARELSREHLVLAIDECTGLCWDGSRWSVRGPGGVEMMGPGFGPGSDLADLPGALE